jgi:NhaA family Na+:H+ antiporter
MDGCFIHAARQVTMPAKDASKSAVGNPPINKARRSLQEFLRLEAAGGILLMIAAVLALLVANSPLSPYYDRLLDLPMAFQIGEFQLAKPLLLWINDGLMAIFFFLVGMELKRELIEGHLSSIRKASLPAFAALGGMLAPALVYTYFNAGDVEAMRGWAIPMATDIAFALGVLALLGPRVPAALKAFLLSVAIFDDIGAIVIVAIFYSGQLSLNSLALALLFIVGLALLNRLKVNRPGAYFLLGIPLWVAVLKSGVHATLAGVVLAMFIPLRMKAETPGEPMLRHLEHSLHPWVAYGVLPIFAFANAGVSLRGLSLSDTLHPVPIGIVAGLFIGKQVGVLGMSALAVRLGLATRPDGMSWRQLHGVALLSGIGFTMSLFIAALAFEQGGVTYFGLERLGILMGSVLSGVLGYVVLRMALDKGPKE